MGLLLLAFLVFLAFALCAYRVAFGPQKQLAVLGLGLGAAAVSLLGLAYPDERSPMLVAGYVLGLGMLLVVAVLALTSILHWLRTPDMPSPPAQPDRRP